MRVWHWGDPVAPLRALLARGGVLAFPTESSYGLGADPRNPAGVETIYRIKGREAGKPLPVVVAGREQLADLGIDPDLHIVEYLVELLAGAAHGGPSDRPALLPSYRHRPAPGRWRCGCRTTRGCGGCWRRSGTA